MLRTAKLRRPSTARRWNARRWSAVNATLGAALATLAPASSTPATAQGLEDVGRGLLRKAANRFTAPLERGGPQAAPRPAPPQPAPGAPAPNFSQPGAVAGDQVNIAPFMTQTADGWKLVARRYWQPGATVAGRLPVILCHGFTYNANFFDLDPNNSLARHLAQRGFDVWVVNLRGAGQSHKWAFSTQGGGEAVVGRIFSQLDRSIPESGYVSIDPKFYKWDLDDYVDHDVPALVALVRQHTGARRVSWLGHSMGGNVALAYLAKNGQDPQIGRLAVVGSQATMPDNQLMMQYLIEMLTSRQAQFTGQPFDSSQAMATFNRLFFNDANVDQNAVNALTTYGFDAPSVGLVQQYMALDKSGKLTTADKKFDYSANLKKIVCPVLICGGAVDQIAPPVVQNYLYENVGSTDKTMLVLGRQAGLSVDYGHNDSLIGLYAQREVFPSL
ncbi:MAG: alpha/beta hydrolase, partial [Planctomycetia bacterium]